MSVFRWKFDKEFKVEAVTRRLESGSSQIELCDPRYLMRHNRVLIEGRHNRLSFTQSLCPDSVFYSRYVPTRADVTTSSICEVHEQIQYNTL